MRTPDLSRLTRAERQVLVLLAQGHTAKSIAAEAGLSIHVINERLREARAKAGVGSSRELARLLRQAGADGQETWPKQFGVDAAEGPPQQIGSGRRPDRPAGSRSTLIMSMAALVLAGGALLVAAERPAAPEPSPRVVATVPAEGARIAAGPFRLSVTFDVPMQPDSYSFVTTDFGAYPDCSGGPSISKDGRTFTLACRAEPGQRYAVGFNYGRFRNFVGRNGTPAEPKVVRFASR